MENKEMQSKSKAFHDCLGFKSLDVTRNVLDCNSVDPMLEIQYCANDYFGFRFLNNQIIRDIGLRPPREKIIQWLKEREFYFIDFNIMCIVEKRSHRYYYPVELGLVKYSMVNGITEEYHTFIDCGKIPDGCAGQAIQYESEHRIPLFDNLGLLKLCFDTVETIVEKLHHLITKDEKTLTKDKKFVCFSIPERRTQTYGGYEWLNLNNDCTVELPEFSVLSVYDLTLEILKFMENKELTNFPVISSEFNTCLYDFDSEILCMHHNEVECNNCAIANCRRLAFVFSSLMSRCFDINPFSTKNLKKESDSHSTNDDLKSIEEDDEAIVKVLKAPPDNADYVTSKPTSLRQRMPPRQSLPPRFENISRQRPRFAGYQRQPSSATKDDREESNGNKDIESKNCDRSIGALPPVTPAESSRLPQRPINNESKYKYKTQLFSRSTRQPLNYDKFEKNWQSAPPGFSGNPQRHRDYRDKNVKYTPPNFSRISNRRANVAKDERRFGTSVKTVPPGFKGNAECKVNIDSVNDALQKANI